MTSDVIFVDSGESFIVRGIVKHLEGLRHRAKVINWSVMDISNARREFSDLVFAYIDDVSEIDEKALIFLRDICVEDNHNLYLIGHESDVQELKDKYSMASIAGEFYRPINANEMAEKIVKMMDVNPMMYRKHILVVDDSGTMLHTIQEWLGSKYRVSIVNSAMNAITFLDKTKPDLILLDYEMPGCSGPQLLEMLRADLRTENVPVMFLTGKGDQESVKKVLALKPAGYLLKNMPRDYIISQVDEFFEKQKKI